MKDLSQTLQEALTDQLNSKGYDIVDLIPIPARADRMVRIRTLEDALNEFESNDNDRSVSYLIQIRQKDTDDQLTSLESFQAKLKQENIYLADGKLNAGYLFKNADLLFKSGDFGLAKNIYKAILSTGEKSAWALLGIGRCHEREGKTADAIANYEESIAYHPTIEAYQRLCALLVQKGKQEQAAETYERALAIKEISVEVRFEIHTACAGCWSILKKIDKAESHLKRAIEINPSSDSARTSLGDLYLSASRDPEAKQCFQDAIATNSRNYQAHFGLGSCLLKEGDKRGAHEAFASSLEIELNNPMAIYYLVKCAYEIKSFATAAKIVGEYIQIAPVNANLLYSLAGLQFHMGRIEIAQEIVAKILELQPDHSGAKELMGLIDRYASSS